MDRRRITIQSHRRIMEQKKNMIGKLLRTTLCTGGAFENMIIKADWEEICYTVKVNGMDSREEILQQRIEFVKFKDNPNPIGVRVTEELALLYGQLYAQN